jgi:hypothetical protein
MNSYLFQILRNRFDVTLERLDDLVGAHDSFFGSHEYLDLARQHFSGRINEITDSIDSGEPIFLTYIFHTVIGALLLTDELDGQKRSGLLKYIQNLHDDLGGYLPIHRSYIERFPKLGASPNTPMVPEIYASYYGFWGERLLGHHHGESEIDGLLTWLLACQQASGLIYNRVYSNTVENRRFESEKTAQLYYAVELLIDLKSSLGDPETETEISLDDARDWVMANFAGLKTVTGRYFALKALLRLAPDEVCSIGIEELRGFLKDRLSSEADGYYDYRLIDKIDESMSSRSLVAEDVNTSHVFGTYYALAMQWVIDVICGGTSEIPVEAIRTLIKQARNDDGGFGRHVKIKAFPTPFGPNTTDLETLLVALMPLFWVTPAQG